MISKNAKYISVPHGIPDHLRRLQMGNERGNDYDRNKVYSQRSTTNPITIPSRITDIPALLARRYDQIQENEVIFECELMKYKPGIKHQYMSRWVQVTKSHFLYFSEGVPYASYLGRPLAVIPLEDI